jgi:hypothetical protein
MNDSISASLRKYAAHPYGVVLAAREGEGLAQIDDDMIEAADELDRLTAENERLRAIVDRLPVTADGVPVTADEISVCSGDTVWRPLVKDSQENAQKENEG